MAARREWIEHDGALFERVLLATRRGEGEQARRVHEMMPFPRPNTRLSAEPMELLVLALNPTLSH